MAGTLTPTKIVGNLFMTQLQLANAMAGFAGVDQINPGDIYIGSYCKICGLSISCEVADDTIASNVMNIDNTELTVWAQIPMYTQYIHNTSGDKKFYAYRTGLTECTLVGNTL